MTDAIIIKARELAVENMQPGVVVEREKAVVSDLWEQQKEIALDYLTDCNKAADRIEAQAAEIERLQRSADSWEADALRYAQNAEYWKAELMEARGLEIRKKSI